MIDLKAYYTQLEVDALIEKEKTKIDNKSIIKNNNNEINIPFDNKTIYYENNVWKTKQSGDIPSDVIKDSYLNKNYIKKVDGKYIIKTSQDINLKQDKLISGTNIKTINGNLLLGSGDISINNNDWEVVNTSDFIRNSKEYTVRVFDNKYYYRINCSVETQFRIYGFTIFVNPKFISEKVLTTYYIGTSIEGYSLIFEWNKNTNYGKITIEKAESEQYLNGIYIERKKINYSNNRNDIKELFNKKRLELNKNQK